MGKEGGPITPQPDSAFAVACRNERPDHVPVWFMRQAGRSLPEYRKVRERFSLLDIATKPELAVEVTLQPVRRLGVDAAILFSDIMVPLLGMGVEFDIVPGTGPVVPEPIRAASDVRRISVLDPETGVPFVLEAVRALRAELQVPLIGFAGAPFTLASYLIEGGPSRELATTKTLMRSSPEIWNGLMQVLTDSIAAYLKAQIEAGAAAVQLFDSWMGTLAPDDYERYVLPWTQKIFTAIGAGVPRIHFGVQTSELLPLMASAGSDVIGVDWRVPLDRARERVDGMPVQGNLDPTVMLAPWPVIEKSVRDVLRRGGGSGHVFNLGHGVLPGTDPDDLARVVDLVHGWSPDG
jgi:uroporphyrinogen decarboxylase